MAARLSQGDLQTSDATVQAFFGTLAAWPDLAADFACEVAAASVTVSAPPPPTAVPWRTPVSEPSP